MAYYNTELKKWQDIQSAMSKIDNDNQSLYFTNFSKEVENRIDEYKFLAEKEKTQFNYVPFPFEAELDNCNADD